MIGPRQPRTCNHPINARTLTGVCQVVRMFSPWQFHVYLVVLSFVEILCTFMDYTVII